MPFTLVKNAQSLSFLKEYAARNIADEKPEAMAEHLRNHTIFMQREKDKSKLVSRINNAIGDKQQQYKQRIKR